MNNKITSTDEPIAIIGMSCIFPKAQTVGDYWRNIRGKVDGISEVPSSSHWDPDKYFDPNPKKPDFTYSKHGGFISPVDFNPAEFGISPTDLEAIDTSQLLSLVVAQGAMIDAGYGPDRNFDKNRVSVILGLTGTLELVIPLGARLGHPVWRAAMKAAGIDEPVINDVIENIGSAYVSWQENSFPGLLGNVAAGRIANRLDLGGTNCVVDAACGSALSALNLAVTELQLGKARMAISGGVDTFNDIFMYMCFSKTPALSPTGHARPFSTNSDGTTLGEGIGMLVMKRLEDAKADGDRIYAVLKSLATSSDGKGKAIYAPSSTGQVKALRRAYEAAGVTPSMISLIEAHGTGTKVGDQIELTGLTEVFGPATQKRPWCAIGSVKSQIGHTKAAAGAAGLIKAVLALKHKVIPPTIKIDQPAPGFLEEDCPFYLAVDKRPWLSAPGQPRIAGVSSFGFGGSNYHAVVEEAFPTKKDADWDHDVEIISLSSNSRSAVESSLKTLTSTFSEKKFREKSAIIRREFDAGHQFRLLFAARDPSQCAALAAKALEQLNQNPDAKEFSTPDGIFFGTGRPEGSVAVVFPGQGAQYPNMGIDLACTFPEAFNTVQLAHTTIDSLDSAGKLLGDILYPIPTWSDEKKKQNEAELQDTRIAQPAIGAASTAAWNVMKRFGLMPSGFVGHSYGELAALCAAGAYDEETLFKLSKRRGELMAGGGEDRGGMIAVSCDIDTIKRFLEEEKLDLTLANHNAPKQIVLSGSHAEIARCRDLLKKNKLRGTVLKVSAAFHSPLVSDAAKPFREFLDNHRIAAPQAPVYSNTLAEPYPTKLSEVKDLLGNQLANSVWFVKSIEKMYDDGFRTFVETGPGSRMCGLIKSILEGKNHVTIALDTGSDKESGIASLAKAVAQLSAIGHQLNLSIWQDGNKFLKALENAPEKPRLTFPICGANYRIHKPFPKTGTAGRAVAAPAASKAAAPVTSQKSSSASTVTTVLQAPAPVPVASKAPQTAQPQQTLSISPQASGIAFETLSTLQKMQQQTADLHRRFLEGQQEAQRSIQTLIERHFPGGVSYSAPAQAVREVPPIQPVQQPVAQAEPAKAPPAATAVPPQNGTGSNRVSEILLEIVSEKTGYPTDMINLDMDMESDLGIDSIKRVEIMSAAQEKMPQLPNLTPEKVSQLRTLRQIVESLSNDPSSAVAATATPHQNGTGSNRVSEILLEIVCEKTGYPTDMINPDMDMESDLGIDSIKRVEIMSALQERLPEVPVVQPEQLGSMRTLAQIIELLGASSGAQSDHGPKAPSESGYRDLLLEIVSQKTGYPPEMINLDMDMESDLGIDSIKRVEIMSALQERLPEAPVVQPSDLATLKTLQQILNYISSAIPGKTAAEQVVPGNPSPVTEAEHPLVRAVLKAEEIKGARPGQIQLSQGCKIIVVDDNTGVAEGLTRAFNSMGFEAQTATVDEALKLVNNQVSGLVVSVPATGNSHLWSEKDEESLKKAFSLVQKFGNDLKTRPAGSVAFLAAVERIDGAFGLSSKKPFNPVSGGISGLVKTASLEWPEIHTKVIDLCPEVKLSDELFKRVAIEVLTPGHGEVGITGSASVFLGEVVEAVKPSPENYSPWNAGETIIITGGARGVTAEAAVALAGLNKPRLVLAGRTPVSSSEPAWLEGLTSESDIKKAIAENHTSGKTSPKQLEVEYRQVQSSREISNTLERIRDAGAEAVYHAVDIRDKAAVESFIKQIQSDYGPIRGLVHGAGVLRDKLILEKTMDQFNDVFETKVKGLRNILEAIKTDELRAVVLFSSITGRRGRIGQSDYSISNEVLNKAAQSLARAMPRCRVVSFNWGPWAGGMVNDALKKVFLSEGIGLVGLRSGVAVIVDELKSPARENVEVVVYGSLRTETSPKASAGIGESRNMATPRFVLAFERVLNPADEKVLRDHRLNGSPVLPMAMVTELLAHGALLENPGMIFHGFDDLRILKGLVFESASPVEIQVYSTRGKLNSPTPTVQTELRSTHGGKTTVHASGTIVMAEQLPTPAKPRIHNEFKNPFKDSIEKTYSEELFHGKTLQGITKLEGWSEKGMSAIVKTAPTPEDWMKEPFRSSWITDPLVLDCAYQMTILWTQRTASAPSLPTFARYYRQFVQTYSGSSVRIAISARQTGSQIASADIEILDLDGTLLARMEGYECVINPALKKAFKDGSPRENSGE